MKEIKEWLWRVKIEPKTPESELDKLVDNAFRELENRINEIIRVFEEIIKQTESVLK
jgi:hypothetical protein